LAQDPLSHVTMAFAGSKGRHLPDHALRVHRIGFRHGASFELLPPSGYAVFDRVRPIPVVFAPDQGEQRLQGFRCVAMKVDFGGIP
jgi:hypothetical protein